MLMCKGDICVGQRSAILSAPEPEETKGRVAQGLLSLGLPDMEKKPAPPVIAPNDAIEESPISYRNAQEPITAVQLHALGVEHTQHGDYPRAVELLGKAVAMRPSVPALHVDLAEAYRNLGEMARAIGCCRTALSLRPDYPEALNTLGLALQGMGRWDEAVEQFRRALAIRPEMVVALNNLGVVYQELGRIDEAIDCYRRVVELAPDVFRARTNLGLALLNQGQTEDALPHFQEAARLQPDMAVLHHNLGNALRALGRNEDARAAYLEATRLDPERADSYQYIGITLMTEGQLGGAVPWYKLATEHEPENPFRWEQLAEVYAERDDFAEVIPCLERVLSLSPAQPAVVHNNLGWAYQEEGRLPEARQHFETALLLQPDFAPAQLHLGGIHQELGEMAEAEAAFRAALRMQPNLIGGYARLATLLRDKLPDPDLAALESRLTGAQLPAAPRARLLFGLAHVLDARADYARAAACLRQANALDVEEAKGERQYSSAEHERFIDSLIEASHPEFFARMAGIGSNSRRPAFVFGLPRSGTTLIEQILASHPQIHGGGERRFGRDSFEAIPSVLGRPGPPIESIPHLNAEAIQRLAEQHLERLTDLDGGRAARVVNKMPDNYCYLGLLSVLFPNAVFIHCRRDVRDVAVSNWMTDFRAIRWASDPAHIASRIREYRRIMAHWRDVLPVTMLEVDYENTVDDLEGVARRLIAACGLEWDPACLEFYRTRRSVRTASVSQVRQPIYTKSVARWKHYEHELADLFAAISSVESEDVHASEVTLPEE
jgi:tetratricopeptide (TPR) repeat protein